MAQVVASKHPRLPDRHSSEHPRAGHEGLEQIVKEQRHKSERKRIIEPKIRSKSPCEFG
jgi:hypothetical protein